MRVTSTVLITRGLVASWLRETDPLLTGTIVYRLITYTNNTKDFMVPQLWGPVRTALVLSTSSRDACRLISCHPVILPPNRRDAAPEAIVSRSAFSPNSHAELCAVHLTPTLIGLGRSTRWTNVTTPTRHSNRAGAARSCRALLSFSARGYLFAGLHRPRSHNSIPTTLHHPVPTIYLSPSTCLRRLIHPHSPTPSFSPPSSSRFINTLLRLHPDSPSAPDEDEARLGAMFPTGSSSGRQL